MAVLFAFMGLDELFEIHEALERALGVNWVLLYLPLVLAGGIGWLATLRTLLREHRVAAAAWAGGAVAWAVAQLLEVWEWDGDVMRPAYYPKMYLEEGLEMVGSIGWLAAMVLVLHAAREHSTPRT